MLHRSIGQKVSRNSIATTVYYSQANLLARFTCSMDLIMLLRTELFVQSNHVANIKQALRTLCNIVRVTTCIVKQKERWISATLIEEAEIAFPRFPNCYLLSLVKSEAYIGLVIKWLRLLSLSGIDTSRNHLVAKPIKFTVRKLRLNVRYNDSEEDEYFCL